MSAFRPMISSMRPAMAPMRSALPRQAGAVRGYASEAPAQSGGGGRTPLLLLGGAALVGAGAWQSGLFEGQKDQIKSATKNVVSTGALDRNAFKDFTLKEVRPYNHDSSTFVFELPGDAVPGMRVASALLVKGAGEGVKDKDGKDVIRPYTPVTSPETKGHLDLLVKKYQNGAMTQHIHGLKPGDTLAFKGPIDKFEYKPNVFEHVGMIAGGSGITPMWQVIQSIANNPEDKTNVTLIYANKTDKDILLREEFDKLAANDNRFKVVYGLDKQPRGFASESFEGYVTPEHISKYMPAPGRADKAKVFVCGPPPQVEAICGGKGPKGSQGELKGLLADAGYSPDQIYKF